MKVVIDNIVVDICDHNVAVHQSYKVNNIKMFVKKLIEYKQYSAVLNQDYRLLCAEFFIHNLCYKLGLFRSHTETVDLSLYDNMNMIERIVYKIIFRFW